MHARSANRFTLSEWCGAVGDLSTLLPFAFALVIFNEFPPQRLFFLWGLAYLFTGWYYRVPVAVQPLKAMAVIAIASGFSVGELATTAVFFGLVMILLSTTGVIHWLERWFTPALVRGVQLGLGLMLLQKALEMIHGRGLYLGQENADPWVKIVLFVAVVFILLVLQFGRKIPITIFIIGTSIALSALFGWAPTGEWPEGEAFQFQIPQPGFLFPALIYLMIPQLPLTLGNAIFAADDACHTFWPERAGRVSPPTLALSIGVSNVFIGMLGGFPICHGAGGIAAHARFGGKTGGTTLIAGGVLILVAILKPLADFLFYIPIPILGALLLFTSWTLIVLVRKLSTRSELAVAVVTGVLALLTRNLTLALLAGITLEYGLNFVKKRYFAGRKSLANPIKEQK